MDSLIYTYIITALLGATILLLSIVLRIAERAYWASKSSEQLVCRYIQQLTSAILGYDEVEHIISNQNITTHNDSERMALAKAIYIVTSHTYSTPQPLIAHLAKSQRLERTILQRLRFTNTKHKIMLLNLLSTIPLSSKGLNTISKYINSSNRHIRIAALLAKLASEPTQVMQTLTQIEYPLRSYDTSRIISLLRRGVLPIAYEPLLRSNNRNLIILGIAIVKAFGIEIAENRLLYIIGHNKESTIVDEAIFALSSQGLSLDHNSIRCYLSTLPAERRNEISRHLASEGYSADSLKRLFSGNEIESAQELINSYKRDLICPQSL